MTRHASIDAALSKVAGELGGRATVPPVAAKRKTRPSMGAAPARNITFRLPAEVEERWAAALALMSQRAGGVEIKLSDFLRRAGDRFADEILSERPKR